VYITEKLELERFCESLSGSEFVTIDTEFSRDASYYPKLCLIQVANNNRAVVIDAIKLDISPLNKILQDSKIVKIFHSARQDLEVLYQLNGCLPKNIFDTQIAASFCGFTAAVSYEALVLEIVGQQIDKSHRVCDWTKRPLSQDKLDYALGDVTHLREVYKELLSRLEENKYLSWAMEEMRDLGNINLDVDIEKSWLKIKHTKDIKMTLVLKKLAAWRELKAQEHNLPRNHYLNEKHLIRLSQNNPITLNELKRISYFKNVENKLGEEIIDIIQKAMELQITEDLLDSKFVRPCPKMLMRLKTLLHKKAEEYNIPAQIIATNAELKDICNNEKNMRCLRGWRYEIFGKFAELE
jgi:ribonuclease D